MHSIGGGSMSQMSRNYNDFTRSVRKGGGDLQLGFDEKWVKNILAQWPYLMSVAVDNSDYDMILELEELKKVVLTTKFTKKQSRRLALYMMGYSIKEIAEKEGITVMMVHKSLVPCFKKISKRMIGGGFV